MKILFVRHGESIDDIEDRYGGGADFDLTENGRKQSEETAGKIITLDEKFEVVLSSPLKRALQFAETISNKLGVETEVFEYLKERNLNGVLTGLVRSEALKKYPELVQKHSIREYVDGSERTDDFNNRVKNAVKYLLEMKYSSVIAVTHGLFLRAFFKIFMNKDIAKVENGALVLVEVKDDKFEILKVDGVEFE